MSTRATYSIQDLRKYSSYKGILTYYIHHDGYESGAACKFLELINKCGNIGHEDFIRNLPASLTNDHESHGDTEYRYDIRIDDKGTSVCVYKRYDADFGHVGTYSLQAFIRKHTGIVVKNKLSWDNKPVPNRFVTLESLTNELEEKKASNGAYKKAHPESLGNIRSQEADVERLKKEIDNFFSGDSEKDDNVKHYIKLLSECLERPYYLPKGINKEAVQSYLDMFTKAKTNYQLGKAVLKIEKAFSY